MLDTMGLPPPEGAVVLFDGTARSLDAWTTRGGGPARWPVLPDGAMRSEGGDLVSRATFFDFALHLEFWCEDAPAHVRGQGRANSGVFLQGRYEIQVLDSWDIGRAPGTGDCGALYGVAAPLVNACRPPETWQTYDVWFRAPRFDPATGARTDDARVTALQNGVAIHNGVGVARQTGAAVDARYDAPGPLLLQDHGGDVRYRNVWVLPLGPRGDDRYVRLGPWHDLVRPTLAYLARRWRALRRR